MSKDDSADRPRPWNNGVLVTSRAARQTSDRQERPCLGEKTSEGSALEPLYWRLARGPRRSRPQGSGVAENSTRTWAINACNLTMFRASGSDFGMGSEFIPTWVLAAELSQMDPRPPQPT